MSFAPVVKRNETNDIKATLVAFPTEELFDTSPMKAPANGPKIRPIGMKNKPAISPRVEPHIAALDPPPTLVSQIGAT